MSSSSDSEVTPVGLPVPRTSAESGPPGGERSAPPPLPPRGEIPAWSRKYIGREIGFRFTIKRALAAGGMGSIFVGEQSNLNRQVAIKLVRTTEADTIQRMRQEAQSLAAVNHPGIVEVHDFIAVTGSKASDCYLVMGYVPGEDLSCYLDTVERGFVPPAEAVELLLPITSALVELHAREMIHRDIKLSNIIRHVGADGVARTKLVDFGFARQKQDLRLTGKGIVVGTPAYFAPEIVLGQSHSPASDVYALGVTLCKLLTGQNPHGEVDIGYLLHKAVKESVALPIWLIQTSLGPLVQAMLKRKPEQRPDMREVLKGLETCLDSLQGLDPGAQEGAASDSSDETDTVDVGDSPQGRATGGSRATRVALCCLGGLCAVLTAAVVFMALRWTPKKAATTTKDSPVAASHSPGPGLVMQAPVGGESAMARVVPRPRQRARPAVMERARPAVMERARPAPAGGRLPSVASIRRGCHTQADMRHLFHPARKVILGKRQGDLELARRTLEALLTAKCTPNVVRHWVSYYLTKAYVKQGKCAGARRAWKLYERFLLKHRRKVEFPKCP